MSEIKVESLVDIYSALLVRSGKLGALLDQANSDRTKKIMQEQTRETLIRTIIDMCPIIDDTCDLVNDLKGRNIPEEIILHLARQLIVERLKKIDNWIERIDDTIVQLEATDLLERIQAH